MMSKAEDSKAQNRESFLRELIWERQKKEEEAARVASEMRRRRMLAEENRTKNQKRVGYSPLHANEFFHFVDTMNLGWFIIYIKGSQVRIWIFRCNAQASR